MTADLLPQNATRLEKSLVDVLDTFTRLSPELARVPTFTMLPQSIPEDWLQWVIEDEGLAELRPFLAPRKVLAEGRKWARERGSAAAIIRAMGWLGQSVCLHYEPDEDENFDLFQIELSAPVGAASLPDIIRLAGLSKPTTDILARIFCGHDARPFRLDHSRLDGTDLLDDWSGVRLEPDGPVISFGGQWHGCAELAPSVAVAMRHAHLAARVGTEEGFRLDSSKLDAELLEPGVVEILTAQSAVVTMQIDTRAAPWPAGQWPGHAWSDFTIEVFGGDHGDHP